MVNASQQVDQRLRLIVGEHGVDGLAADARSGGVGFSDDAGVGRQVELVAKAVSHAVKEAIDGRDRHMVQGACHFAEHAMHVTQGKLRLADLISEGGGRIFIGSGGGEAGKHALEDFTGRLSREGGGENRPRVGASVEQVKVAVAELKGFPRAGRGAQHLRVGCVVMAGW